jgi:SAM-dependent methyltransferase
LIRPARLRGRIAQALDFEIRPDFAFIGSAIRRALQDRLAGEDSATRNAVVMGQSMWLAEVLGLRKTRILHLPYPDFTIENLALLSDEYDFVIADRVLHRCDDLQDAARETLRVLRPGGWFVHTTSLFDMRTGVAFDRRRLAAAGLRALFPDTLSAGGGVVSWVIGQKSASDAESVRTVATRKSKRTRYRCSPRPATFGVIAVARNEAPYLLEWVAHYRVLGFEQITIYDNQSNDASARILGPLARAGIVNARYWPDRSNKQRRAYTNAIRRLRPFVQWCLFVDLDEYLVLEPGTALKDLLPTDPDVAGVGIPWRMYGSAGLRNRATGLTIERFTMTKPTNNRHVKSLVRLRDVDLMGIHIPKRFRGRLVDVAGNPIAAATSGLLPRPSSGAARINHYFNRSWEEFESKRARGRGAAAGAFHSVAAFDRHGPGDIELLDTLRYVPPVKEEIARLRKIVDAG